MADPGRRCEARHIFRLIGQLVRPASRHQRRGSGASLVNRQNALVGSPGSQRSPTSDGPETAQGSILTCLLCQNWDTGLRPQGAMA